MSVRVTNLAYVIVDGAGNPQVSVAVQATLLLPNGAAGVNPVDSAGEAIDRTPLQTSSDPVTGAVSINVIPPGDIYQNVSGSLVSLAGCTWQITYLATVLTSPNFAYTASINPLSWSTTPSSLGLIKCYLTDVFGSALPVVGRTYSVSLSQDAVWSGGIGANRQVPGQASDLYTTSAGGTSAVYRIRQSELTPSGTDWVLVDTVTGTIRYFQAPTLYTNDAGVYAGGTTYALGKVVRRAVDDEPFVSLVNGNVGNALTDVTKWANYPGENILLRTVAVSPPGQQAVSAANIAADATLQGALIGSPASVQDVLSNLLYVDAYGDLVVKSKTTTYTVLPGDDAIIGDATGGNWSLTLDSAALHTKALYLTRKDTTTTVWTILPHAGETIAGLASITVPVGVGYALIPVSATDWRLIGAYGDYPTVEHNGSVIGKRNIVNIIDGANVTTTVADNPGASRVDVTLATSGVAGLSNQSGGYIGAAQPPLAPASTSFIDQLRGGFHSNTLGNVSPAGLREFDIQYVAGVYYIAYDDYTNNRAILRHATTIAGLPGASTTTTVPGSYPSLYYDGALWHVFSYDTAGNTSRHYTNATFAAGFTLADSPMAMRDDVQMRLSPLDGKFYMASLDVTSGTPPYPVKMLQATTLTGPANWTDMGDVFSVIGYPQVAYNGVFDPTPVFWNGRAYLMYTAQQVAGYSYMTVVELDPATMKAIGTNCVFVEPLELWQQQNGSSELSNPILVSVPGSFGQERVYYTQKPNASVASPWGYVQVGPAPNDGRRANDFLRLDCAVGTDIAAGLRANAHGGATWGTGGLTATATPSGAFGILAGSNLTDFTITVQFSMTSIPGANGLLIRGSPFTMGTDQVAIYVGTSGLLVGVVIGSTTLTLTGVTTLVAANKYRVTLRRLGSAVTLYLGSSQEAAGTQGDALTGLSEWSIANDHGVVQAAGEQLLCTVFGAVLCGEALPLSHDPLIGMGSPGSGAGAFASLSDVNVTSPNDRDLAIYRVSDGKWHNINPAGAGAVGWAPLTDSTGALIVDSTGACIVAPFNL